MCVFVTILNKNVARSVFDLIDGLFIYIALLCGVDLFIIFNGSMHYDKKYFKKVVSSYLHCLSMGIFPYFLRLSFWIFPKATQCFYSQGCWQDPTSEYWNKNDYITLYSWFRKNICEIFKYRYIQGD